MLNDTDDEDVIYRYTIYILVICLLIFKYAFKMVKVWYWGIQENIKLEFVSNKEKSLNQMSRYNDIKFYFKE